MSLGDPFQSNSPREERHTGDPAPSIEVPQHTFPPSFNFDKELERVSTDSLKWRKHPEDVLPMWVADMDFESPAEISNGLLERLQHRCYGYPIALPRAVQAIQDMLKGKYNWEVEAESIIFLPALVPALAMASRMTAREDKPVIVPTPCYPPFFNAPKAMDCRSIELPLTQDHSGSWRLDIDSLYRITPENGCSLFFCNPHNPSGHVFRREELIEISEWANSTDSTIIADEIHCELILDKSLKHLPIATIDGATESRTITFMSPSKTFNVAGIGVAFAIVPDSELRCKFHREGDCIVPGTSIFGLTACETAYRECEPWRLALLDYLRENSRIVCETLAPYRKLVTVHPPEATYLAWLDFTATGWENPAAVLLKEARVALGEGNEFHMPYHARFNFGCTRKNLLEGLKRITNLLEQF